MKNSDFRWKGNKRRKDKIKAPSKNSNRPKKNIGRFPTPLMGV